MISAFEPSFSTNNKKNIGTPMRSKFATRRIAGVGGPVGMQFPPFNRALEQERAFGSLWNPKVLDSLRVPLTRYHE
jgi:hypothetical protein